MNPTQQFAAWLTKQETRTDRVTWAPLRRLAAMLDRDVPPEWENELPPLSHWLFHLPEARQSELGADGHPHKGGFMPPIPLPRRMWAGSRIRFLKSIAVGAQLVRRSTISQISSKPTQSGKMVLMTVRHDILCDGEIAIEEEQDVAYIDAQNQTSGQASRAVTLPDAQFARRCQPTSELLFRFSALTFNAHRIHYDRNYARDVEHYPGLVVQGPLLATLLVDHFFCFAPATRVTRFSFRAHAPTFEDDPFDLCLATQPTGTQLWVTDAAGEVKMTAQIESD